MLKKVLKKKNISACCYWYLLSSAQCRNPIGSDMLEHGRPSSAYLRDMWLLTYQIAGFSLGS